MSEPDTSSDMTAVMAAMASGDLSELVRALIEERNAAFAALDLMPLDDEDLEPWPEAPPDDKPASLRLHPDHMAIRSTRCGCRACRRHRKCMLPPAWCGNPRKAKPRSHVQKAGAADDLLRRAQAMEQQMVEQQKAKEAAKQSKRKLRYWEKP